MANDLNFFLKYKISWLTEVTVLPFLFLISPSHARLFPSVFSSTVSTSPTPRVHTRNFNIVTLVKSDID